MLSIIAIRLIKNQYDLQISMGGCMIGSNGVPDWGPVTSSQIWSWLPEGTYNQTSILARDY